MHSQSPHCPQQPRLDSLGYQAALDLGVSALDAGATAAAVSYLSHAVAVRPTRFALVRLATALRDQGQLEPARERLLQARALPDGEDPYVIVSLAAVLCDLSEYEGGLAAAKAAIDLDAANPAALNVAARCVREIAGMLERGPAPSREELIAVRAVADDFARRAADADRESAGDALRRRRERTVQQHLIVAHSHAVPPSTAVCESPEGGVPPASPQPTHAAVVADTPTALPLRWWRRLLTRLTRSNP